MSLDLNEGGISASPRFKSLPAHWTWNWWRCQESIWGRWLRSSRASPCRRSLRPKNPCWTAFRFPTGRRSNHGEIGQRPSDFSQRNRSWVSHPVSRQPAPVSFCRGIPAQRAGEAFVVETARQTAQKARNTWPDLLTALPLPEPMREKLREHWATLPLYRM